MKKIYVAPEMEVIDVEMSSILASSDEFDPGTEPGYEGSAQAPGMMSFDDMDEDFIDEDNI